MKIWAILALVAWTALVMTTASITGSPLATPSCPHLETANGTFAYTMINPSCASEMAAENARVWATRTLPLLIVLLGGYGAILLTSILRTRRAPQVTFTDAD